MKAVILALLCLAPAARAAEAPEKYAWREDWPRFRKSEYAVTAVAAAGAAANFFLVPAPKSAVWKGDIGFDRQARGALLIPSEKGRDAMKTVADALSGPLIAYAFLDGPVTAGWYGGNKDTAIQLALINAETFSVIEVLNLTVSNVLPRSRPPGATCDPNSLYDPHCTKSFWSGHTANVFAAATLICSEHRALDLYGGGKADDATCAAGFAVAAAVGVSRVATNNHRASDVVVGAAMGAAVGYFVPNYLHFRSNQGENRLGYLIPAAGPQGGGLTYVKTW